MSRGAARRRSYGPRQRELKRRPAMPIDALSDVGSGGRLEDAAETLTGRGGPGFERGRGQPGAEAS